MADIRNSKAGPKTNQARLQKPGGSGRTPQDRRVISRPGNIPQWAYVALLVGPGIGIVILLALKLFSGGPRQEVKEVKPDPNSEINSLQAEIPELKKSQQEVFQLLQSEDPKAKASVDSQREKLYGWIDRWDKLFDNQRDEKGNYPKELLGYARIRSQVNMLLNDLNRITPF